jgi:pimeloyl-ACP methyl ester carboxylesterase
MVLLPGYGSGSALWFRNLKFLASAFHVHAVDLLGMGLSGRPPYAESTRAAAEAWFVSGLEEWRARTPAVRDTPFVLVGHSLGGYLAAAYATAHPHRVSHLVLVCPAGVAHPPAGWVDEATGKATVPAWAAAPWSLSRLAFKTALAVWEAGLTPGGVVRSLGPVGPGLVKRYVRGRFRDGADLDGPEAAAVERYFYALLAGRSGSGEHALSHLLAPFAWGRHPLSGRLHEVGVPVSLIYGERDWMDPSAGVKAAAAAKEALGRGYPRPGVPAEADLAVAILPSAGHYAFLDAPAAFAAAIAAQASYLLPPAAAAALRAAAADAAAARHGAAHLRPGAPPHEAAGGDAEGVAAAAAAAAATPSGAAAKGDKMGSLWKRMANPQEVHGNGDWKNGKGDGNGAV